ncbi:MAG: phytanoyl-CoA dioxygenase family protein [Candidatus Latescibacteria bacterium]|nr:phytanoyl-CoA dioxygenase family protein [Candidatus Latescibacterota bacterium]MBT4140986.1 phytanoyl-CoA dioxygenase family protein [Candidatus Latescibacterota bacterium]MBT5829345.1 phytanoyl-CoA dioxygenase family protein [Candidatus Latescibacterota bacterium]
MVISLEQREQFQEQGYCIVPDMFTQREVTAMCGELDRFKREGLLRNVSTEGDGKTHSTDKINLQICPITPKSTFYRALPFHTKVIVAVGHLIGNPFVFYLDQIFLKPPKQGQGTSWHQDNGYFKISDPSKGVGMWVALHDATVANGTLHIVPGSHTEAIPHERDPNSDHHICCSIDESRAIPVELPAGGAVFFNFGIAHSTKVNNTDKERAGLALHFLNTDFIPDEAKEKKNFAHLTGLYGTGGKKEYGAKISGTWPDEVERILNSEKPDDLPN